MKICGIYKITNTITGDFYIGSSKDVNHRWESHKWPSIWKQHPNNQLYKDMQKYGLNKFEFQVIAEVEESFLKEKEQQFIETLKPTYNNYRANGWDIERYKETQNQLCSYNGETLTLNALRTRFKRQGISNPTQEAKKYLFEEQQ